MADYWVEVVSDSPIAYYRLGPGATCVDVLGSHSGSYVNAPDVGVGGVTPDENGAVAFNGTNQRADLTTLGTLGSNIVTSTWEAWVKTTAAAGPRAVFGTVNTGTSMIVALYVNSGGAGSQTNQPGDVGVQCRGSAGNLEGWVDATVNDGRWHHIVVRIDSATTMSIFVDGVSRTVTYTAQVSVTAANFTHAMMLAARNVRGVPDRFFQGTIDEVALYTTRLSDARILAHYVAGQTMIASSAGLSSSLASLAVARSLAGTSVGTGATAGSVGVARSLSASSAGSSTSTGFCGTHSGAGGVLRRDGCHLRKFGSGPSAVGHIDRHLCYVGDVDDGRPGRTGWIVSGCELDDRCVASGASAGWGVGRQFV